MLNLRHLASIITLICSLHTFASSDLPSDQLPVCLLDLQAYFSEDMYLKHSDIQGDTFVGGNAYLKNFLINGTLEVNHHLKAQNGTIAQKIFANSAEVKNIGYRKRVNTEVDLQTKQFYYKNQLISLSKKLSELKSNTDSLISNGVISIKSNQNFSVVNLRSSDLKKAYELNLSGASNSFLILNIENDTDGISEFRRMTLNVQGLISSNIIYNFFDTKYLSLAMVGPKVPEYGTGVQGSIIAPYADIRFYMGVIDGGIYAKSLEETIPTGQIDPVRIDNIFLRQLICD